MGRKQIGPRSVCPKTTPSDSLSLARLHLTQLNCSPSNSMLKFWIQLGMSKVLTFQSGIILYKVHTWEPNTLITKEKMHNVSRVSYNFVLSHIHSYSSVVGPTGVCWWELYLSNAFPDTPVGVFTDLLGLSYVQSSGQSRLVIYWRLYYHSLGIFAFQNQLFWEI